MKMIDIFDDDHPEWSIFTAVEEILCSSRRFQRRYRPWLNSYQRTDYLNGLFYRPVDE
jgi:hypothetical protein